MLLGLGSANLKLRFETRYQEEYGAIKPTFRHHDGPGPAAIHGLETKGPQYPNRPFKRDYNRRKALSSSSEK